MSRIKSIFAVLLLTAVAGIAPLAHAQTFKVVAAGSSALWQTLALGAYGGGTCNAALTGCVSPTFHWTSGSAGSSGAPYLLDNRGGANNQDSAGLWVVWDSASTPNVWVFAKVDSVVGVRCYFAKPQCTVQYPTSSTSTGAGKISSNLWGADTTLDASIKAALATGVTVNAAATDIRPEDAAFAAARVNSALGTSTIGKSNGNTSDGLDGLGYNANNPAGVHAVYPAGLTKGVGTPIKSGLPGAASTDAANVLAFNIVGHDPITNTLTATYTVTPVGAAPIVFIKSNKDNLASIKTATENQLQKVFSGAVCDASALGGSGGINIFLREPLSGTMNTTEATVFRHATTYANTSSEPAGGVLGVSQEANVGSLNPLSGQAGACVSGAGARYRGIGTGEVVEGVLCSHNEGGSNCPSGSFAKAQDGIAYTFFSYGNVSKLAGSASYGYIALNGVDPIFQSYTGNLDPGQPTQAAQGGLPAGTLPANTPCGTGSAAFPCDEAQIWSNGFSFPNLRNGTYRSWSLLRLVATGTGSTNVIALRNASQAFVVSSVPDYVPVGGVTCTNCNGTGVTITDVGLKLLRSHYVQRDGNGFIFGAATAVNEPTEAAGDMGGLIIPTTTGVTSETKTQIVQQGSPETGLDPIARPQ